MPGILGTRGKVSVERVNALRAAVPFVVSLHENLKVHIVKNSVIRYKASKTKK